MKMRRSYDIIVGKRQPFLSVPTNFLKTIPVDKQEMLTAADLVLGLFMKFHLQAAAAVKMSQTKIERQFRVYEKYWPHKNTACPHTLPS
jgi:hypothetical protein